MSPAAQRALIISPSFFGYERDIVAELEGQGWSTLLVDERPSNTALVRALLRVRKQLAKGWVDRYYRSWQRKLRGEQFDLVLVVKAEVVPRWFLEQLRADNPSARFVFYTYDALANAGNCLEVLDCFDTRLSFDREDVACRNDFNYLPLFYVDDFDAAPSNASQTSRAYDLAFVGTLHTERYTFAQRCFADSHATFGFFFVPARWYFFVLKYITREHRDVPWSEVSFDPMAKRGIAEIFKTSHAVLDMQRSGQHGLTMRTFEVLASGAILVTTNAAITLEPFFDPARVVVVPTDPAEIDSAALYDQLASRSRPGAAPPGFERYSLRSWIHEVSAGAAPGKAMS